METTQSHSSAVTRVAKAVVYPVRDGKPLGEDESHVRETLNCIQFLQFWFRDRPDAYVMGNNFVYWREGSPRDRVSPDCYVVFGVDKRVRPSYKCWEEGGKLPDVVFEFTSKSTMQQDIDRKFGLYEQVWKAQEYFLFDPNREFLVPPLQGYRLDDGRYVPIKSSDGRMHSEQLALDLEEQGAYLRFFDPAAGQYIPTLAESASQTEAERERATAERERAAGLETENARLRAELEALRHPGRTRE